MAHYIINKYSQKNNEAFRSLFPSRLKYFFHNLLIFRNVAIIAWKVSSGQDVVEVMLALHQVLHMFRMNVKYCRTKLQFKHLVSSWEVGNRHCMHPHSGWYCHVKVTDVHLLLLPECDGKTFQYCNISKSFEFANWVIAVCPSRCSLWTFFCVCWRQISTHCSQNAKFWYLRSSFNFPIL